MEDVAVIPDVIRAAAQRLLRVPEVKVVNHDTEVMRALITENAELRDRLGLPMVSSIQLADGRLSRISYDLPPRMWARRLN